MHMQPCLQAGWAESARCDTTVTRGRHVVRFVLALMLAVTALAGVAGFATNQASAGQAATVVADGAGLMAGVDDQTVVAVMYAGERVDVLSGPHNGNIYEIYYYGVHGYAWAEHLSLDPGGDLYNNAVGGSGGGEAWTAPQPAEPAPEPGPERWIDINRSTNAVTLFVGDVPQATYYGSLGYDTSDYGFNATAIGTYYVYYKQIELNYTPFAQAYITHWVGFDPERFNGFHSYTKDANGTILPNGAGKTAGCVALAPGEIDAVYDFAEIGMRVEIHW